MKNLFLKIYPALTILLFPVFFVHRLFKENYLFYGEERGFLNYDFVNYRYDTIWETAKNFGAITSNHFNIFTTGFFWKITTYFGVSNLHAEMLFYYFITFSTVLFGYLAFKKVSNNKGLPLLMGLTYITTYNYYATITTTPKMIQVIILPMTLYFWLQFIDTRKLRYFILNTLLLGLFLGIGINPPQMIGAYIFIFLYIGFFNFQRKNIPYIILFLTPFVLNILFVFILNTIVIRHSGQVFSYDIFKEVFNATKAVAYEIMRFFGAWWDYAGSGGLFYNHIGPYYHSFPGIIITYIPFALFLYLIVEQKRENLSLRNKLIALTLLLLFFVKGGAMPFGELFDKAYQHISLLRIFREPWAKFIADFIFAVYVSIVYLYTTTHERAQKIVLYILTFLFIFQLIPLTLGLVIDHRNISWKISDVNVPSYWNTIQHWTKQNTQNKRILVLPARVDDGGTMVQNWRPYYFIGYPDDYYIYGDIINSQYNSDEDKYITQNFLKNLTPQLLQMASIEYVIDKLDIAPQQGQVIIGSDAVSSSLDLREKLRFDGVNVFPVKEGNITERLRVVSKIFSAPENCADFFKKNKTSDFTASAYIHKNVTAVAGNISDSKPQITRIDKTDYKVDFDQNSSSNTAIFLAETFNTGWQWYDSTSTFAQPVTVENNHQKANCFANLWIFPKNETEAHSTLYLRYAPQVMYERMKIAYLTIIALLMLIGFGITRTRKSTKSADSQTSILSPHRIITSLFMRYKPKHFGKLTIEYRLIFLTITLIMLVFDFLDPRAYHDLYIVLFTIFWMITSISYKLNPKVNMYAACFFLFLIVVNRLASFIYMADKLGVWTIMFIAYIGMYSLIYDYITVERTDTFESFMMKVKQDIAYFEKYHSKILSKSLWFLHGTLEKSRYWIIRIYGMREKTTRDWIVLWSKIAITGVILSIGFFIFNKIDSKVNRFSFDPVVQKVEPSIIYPSTKVIIWGENFGWKEQEGSILQNQYGEVRTDVWTNTKIVFETPLSWPPGLLQFRIVKPSNYEGRHIYAVSKIFKIQLLPRGNEFTPMDDEFFRQLKDLDPETREINGY